MKNQTFSRRAMALSAGLLMTLGMSGLPSLANGNISSNVRQGLPGRRISGGVRLNPSSDSCFTDLNQSLVAVMPRDNLGLTAQSRPTFWFSVPETTEAKAVEFELLTADGELLYSTHIEMGNEAGLSDFQLPADAPGLSQEEYYRWGFSVSCNNGSQSPTLVLQGWVRQVALDADLEQQIEQAAPADRPALYAEAGLWLEHVDALMSLRRETMASSELHNGAVHSSELSHDEIHTDWETLISSEGLEAEVSDNITTSMRASEVVSTQPSWTFYY